MIPVAAPCVQPRDRGAAGAEWEPRTAIDLLLDQLAGIARWNRDDRAQAEVDAEQALVISREVRLDVNRHRQARVRERQAVLERAGLQLQDCLEQVEVRTEPRVVIAHRNMWWACKLADCLHDLGVATAAVVQDGAQAVGPLVVDQPDVLVVEDRLPTLTGLELIDRAHRCSPHTLVAVQLLDLREESGYRRAGSHLVVGRQQPPDQLAAALLTGLLGGRRALTPL